VGTDPLPPLHAVTDDAVLARDGFVRAAREVLAAGGPAVALHLRGPRTAGAALYALAAALRGDARGAGALLVVNDRVDVALAAGADGVQLGARSLRADEVRAAGGARLRIGRSVHAAAGARGAAAEGAEWVLAGTVNPTPSHPGRPGAGPALVSRCVTAGLPVVAIGGITPADGAGLRAAGAAGIAAVRGIWDAPDAAAAAREYLNGWTGDG
jgi:thiamine-phosphate diphosphorylase